MSAPMCGTFASSYVAPTTRQYEPVNGCEPKSFQVPSSLDRLAVAITDLDNTTCQLANRLNPVCRNEPSKDTSDGGCYPSQVDLADAISGQEIRVRNIVSMLGSVLDRLEV